MGESVYFFDKKNFHPFEKANELNRALSECELQIPRGNLVPHK
jgi:hypothetical protein